MNDLNPFDNYDIASYNVNTFGKSVRQRREQLGITLRGMAKRLGMSPVYLSEIERGMRRAPSGSNSKIDYMSILAKELCLTDEQQLIYALMAKFSHLNQINLIDNYIINNPSSLKFLLNAIVQEMPNEKWDELCRLLFD